MKLFSDRNEMLSALPKQGVVAEIGVYRGEFAETILETTQPRELYLIDCWQHQTGDYERDSTNVCDEAHRQNYLHTRRLFVERPNVHLLPFFSDKAARLFDDHTFDWIYLDACHLYEAVKTDLLSWWPKIKPGGLMSGHDYCVNSWIDTRHAVDDFLAERELKLDYLTQEDFASWAVIKPG